MRQLNPLRQGAERDADSMLASLTGMTRLEAAQSEIAELKARLAAKPDADDKAPGDDADPDDKPDEPGKPGKGKKGKKAKGEGTPDEDKPEGDEGEDDGSEERPNPKPPKKNDDDENKGAYRAQVAASVAAILDADARRRGVLFPEPLAAASDDPYWGRVNATAAAIVAANNRRHGVVETPVPLPTRSAEAADERNPLYDPSRSSDDYSARVDATARAILKAAGRIG